MTLSELKVLIGKGRMPTLEIHAFEGIIFGQNHHGCW